MTRNRARSSRPATRKRRLSALRAPLTLCLAGALLAGCGGGGTEESSASGAAGTKMQDVTFLNILPLESLSFTPELVAHACGYFEDEGLNVTFEATQGSAPAIQTVLAGSALITRVGDIETVLAAGEKKAPLVNVGTVTKRGPIRFVSSKKDPITTAEDLRGRLMGTPSEGGTSQITLQLVAASAGIDPKDVKTQVVGLAPGVFDLVESGRIGGYIVSLDTAVALQQQQPDAVIFDPSDAIKSGSQIYVTSQEQAKDSAKQEQVRKYLAAIKKTIQFIVEDEANGFTETMNCIKKEYKVPALDNEAVAREALSQFVGSWTAAGEDQIARTVPEQWNAVYDEMLGADFIKDGLDPAAWFTNDFAPETK
jgi:NitT/TauT family transport system substrate-binding protein